MNLSVWASWDHIHVAASADHAETTYAGFGPDDDPPHDLLVFVFD